MNKLDYKKEYKDLYLPKAKPTVIQVPSISFIMVKGVGNPNQENGDYQNAMEILYGLSYTIKMSKLGNAPIDGYFDYVVPPLEGLWWLENSSTVQFHFEDKKEFHWISMIRQPDFVTPEIFEWAKKQLIAKKPTLDFSKTTFQAIEEGLCMQMMHIGPYDNEPATIALLNKAIEEAGYETALGDTLENNFIRRHHEIYFGDPRKIKPEKLKTVIRIPMKKKIVS